MFFLSRKSDRHSKLAAILGRQSHSQLSSIYSLVAVIEFTADGVIIGANEPFLELFGYKLAQVKGRHHRIFCQRGAVADMGYQSFWRELAQGQAQRGAFRRLHKSGRVLWIDATYIPIRDDSGKVVKVLKLANDVTTHLTRLERQDSVIAALHKSLAIIEFTPQGEVLDANSNFCRLMEYDAGELIGSHHRILCEDDFYARHPDFWQRLARGEFQSGLYARITRRGRKVWLDAIYNPVFDDSGQVVRVVKFASDVTARIERTQALHGASLVDLIKETQDLQQDHMTSATSSSADIQHSLSDLRPKLAAQSEKISQLLATITQVTDQTNLLAVNAGLSAAHGDESGRGLAVVAGEMRSLARNSMLATRTIATLAQENSLLAQNHDASVTDISMQLQRCDAQLNHTQLTMVAIADEAAKVSRSVARLLNRSE